MNKKKEEAKADFKRRFYSDLEFAIEVSKEIGAHRDVSQKELGDFFEKIYEHDSYLAWFNPVVALKSYKSNQEEKA